MWHGWIIIRNSDSAVIGTEEGVPPPAGAWQSGFFTVKEVTLLRAPLIHDPDEGVTSYDPTTPSDVLSRVDFEQLADDAQAEIDWLDMVIPQIPTADLQQLRDGLERLAKQNRAMLKAWKYVLKRF